MTEKKTWFITGAGRGMGVDFAKAALAAGHAVVATGRNPASKLGLEGWMESLAPEVEPFGIHTTIVKPGFFRTELLTNASATYAQPSLEDYAERSAPRREWFDEQNGRQAGDPAKLAQVLLSIADEARPPRRFIAGADAIGIAEQKVAELEEQIDAYDELSSSLAHEHATAGVV